MRIAIGVDHAGFAYLDAVITVVQDLGHDVDVFGATSGEARDYPDVALQVGQAVQRGDADLGILMCGTGIGMSIAANKLDGVRAAVCHELFTARLSREHNNANVLCLGTRVMGIDLVLETVRVWLRTSWSSDERHIRRVGLIQAMEAR